MSAPLYPGWRCSYSKGKQVQSEVLLLLRPPKVWMHLWHTFIQHRNLIKNVLWHKPGHRVQIFAAQTAATPYLLSPEQFPPLEVSVWGPGRWERDEYLVLGEIIRAVRSTTAFPLHQPLGSHFTKYRYLSSSFQTERSVALSKCWFLWAEYGGNIVPLLLWKWLFSAGNYTAS